MHHLYLSYLQVLDAISSGAKPSEITSELFPNMSNEDPSYLGNKSVRNYRNAAIKLRDGKYFSLSTFDM